MLTLLWMLHRGMDEDISRLKTTAVGLLSDLGCNGLTLTEDLINEMCRFGASELHAVAAFIGGIASQEVIKVFLLPYLIKAYLHIYINKVQKLVEWKVFKALFTFMRWHVSVFTTADNKTICTHVRNFHLQWHWSQVSVVVTLVVWWCFQKTGKFSSFLGWKYLAIIISVEVLLCSCEVLPRR